MDYGAIFAGKVTVEDLCELNKLGYTFVIRAGHIIAAIQPRD